MRKFNFNSFGEKDKPAFQEDTACQKPRYSAYRTVISKHDSVAEKLKNEPSAVIKNDG